MNPPRYAYTAAAVLVATIPLTTSAASRKPECTIRFHMEVRSAEQDPFSTPITLQNPTRHVFIESTASISERQVRAIHIFPAADGSWGCLFQLDDSGRLTLSNISSSNRGRSLVFFMGSNKTSRQVLDLLIDRPVSDGFVPVSRGLTWAEAELLKKRFPVEIKPAEKR